MRGKPFSRRKGYFCEPDFLILTGLLRTQLPNKPAIIDSVTVRNQDGVTSNGTHHTGCMLITKLRTGGYVFCIHADRLKPRSR